MTHLGPALEPDFTVDGRPFWRLRKNGRPMDYWLTEEPDGGHECSLLAFDIRTLPGWRDQDEPPRPLEWDLVSLRRWKDRLASYQSCVLENAVERGIDLVAHTRAAWAARHAADQQRQRRDDFDADIPF